MTEPLPQEIRCDARIELLGAVQTLTAKAPVDRALTAPLALLAQEFLPWRGHPIVRAYAAAAEDPYALLSLFLTEPPRLQWGADRTKVSGDFLRQAGGEPKLEEFLGQLRDFARVSDFEKRFKAYRAEYRRCESLARAELRGLDFTRRVEDYVGVKLDSRLHIFLSMLYQPGRMNSYIIPYPYRGPDTVVPGPFEVYVLAAPTAIEKNVPQLMLRAMPSRIFGEILYAFIEPASVRFQKEIAAQASLWDRLKTETHFSSWHNCANHLIAMTVIRRLSLPFGEDMPWPKGRLGDCEKKLARAFESYESRREEFPTLLDFYPSIMKVFADCAKEAAGQKSRPKTAPPKIQEKK